MNIARWFALLILFGIALPAAAQDDWTGKRVILKRPGLKIGHSDPKTGQQIHTAELTQMSYTALADKDGFLRLQHRGAIGWLSKNEALLPEEAIPFFAEQAKAAKPDDSTPLAFLGMAYKERKQFPEALKAYDDAIKREPRADWFINRGLVHQDMKKYDLALADFSEAIKRNPAAAIAFENRAETYERMNKLMPALDDWSQALRLEPANGPYLMRRAKLYVDQKEFDKAVGDLTAILKDDPKNVAVLVERGQLLADLHKIDAALADYSAALEAKTGDANLLLGRSQLYTEKKEYAKAIADAEAALAAVPTFADAMVARGWNRFLTGAFEQASADYAKAIATDPKNPAGYNAQAWLWATCPEQKYRDGKKAVESAKKAVELTQGKEPAILDTQAAALAEAGDFDAAVKVQEQVIRALGDGEPSAEARTRIELYRKKQPYRQAIEAGK